MRVTCRCGHSHLPASYTPACGQTVAWPGRGGFGDAAAGRSLDRSAAPAVQVISQSWPGVAAKRWRRWGQPGGRAATGLAAGLRLRRRLIRAAAAAVIVVVIPAGLGAAGHLRGQPSGQLIAPATDDPPGGAAAPPGAEVADETLVPHSESNRRRPQPRSAAPH
jgi:hypothetical protein